MPFFSAQKCLNTETMILWALGGSSLVCVQHYSFVRGRICPLTCRLQYYIQIWQLFYHVCDTVLYCTHSEWSFLLSISNIFCRDPNKCGYLFLAKQISFCRSAKMFIILWNTFNHVLFAITLVISSWVAWLLIRELKREARDLVINDRSQVCKDFGCVVTLGVWLEHCPAFSITSCPHFCGVWPLSRRGKEQTDRR